MKYDKDGRFFRLIPETIDEVKSMVAIVESYEDLYKDTRTNVSFEFTNQFVQINRDKILLPTLVIGLSWRCKRCGVEIFDSKINLCADCKTNPTQDDDNITPKEIKLAHKFLDNANGTIEELQIISKFLNKLEKRNKRA